MIQEGTFKDGCMIDMKVYNEHGCIYYPGETDTRDVDIHRSIRIERNSIDVYPHDAFEGVYPSKGSKLNRQAILSYNRHTDDTVDSDTIYRYTRIARRMNARYVNLTPFQFIVEVDHFTKYQFDDNDVDVDDSCVSEEGREESARHLNDSIHSSGHSKTGRNSKGALIQVYEGDRVKASHGVSQDEEGMIMRVESRSMEIQEGMGRDEGLLDGRDSDDIHSIRMGIDSMMDAHKREVGERKRLNHHMNDGYRESEVRSMHRHMVE